VSGQPLSAPIAADEAQALFQPLAGFAHILVAVSGGPDSVALLALLAHWSVAHGGKPVISAATVDHGLRPTSAGEAAAVAALCEQLGVSHGTLLWTGEKPEAGLQANARQARYALLFAHAKTIGATCLVTAHTLDDQAETVMMRLARGSGPAGLAGMRRQVRRGDLVHARPLLDVAKARLVATCADLGLAYVKDPSNGDPKFTRSRWRRLMPLLAAEGLTAERLARFAGRAAQIEALVEAQARSVIMQARIADQPQFDAKIIFSEPQEIAIRALAFIVVGLVARQDGQHLRLDRLEILHGELATACACGMYLRRSLGGVIFTLDGAGTLEISAEGPRKRGRSPQL
jgi:tRNA(Ile)-lysidine synthase